jgi:hypothetical protein
MAVLHQTAADIGSHAAQSDDPNLHENSSMARAVAKSRIDQINGRQTSLSALV